MEEKKKVPRASKKLIEMFGLDKNDETTISQLGGKATFNFTLPRDVIENRHNPRWLAEQKRKRALEDNYDLGYEEEHEKHPDAKVKMHSLFEMPTAYKILSSNKSDPRLRSSLRQARSASYRGETKSFLSNRTMRGIQESIDVVSKNEKTLGFTDQLKFSKWLNNYGYQANLLTQEEYDDLYVRYKKETRIRLDILMQKMIEMVDGYFVKIFLDNYGSSMTQKQIEDFVTDDEKRIEMIKDYVRENGPLVKMEQFTLMSWYLNKYGYIKEDNMYFRDDTISYVSYSGNGEPMANILNKFRDCTGYEFTDLYEYHYNLYKNNGGLGVTLEDQDNNDTEEVIEDEDVYEVVDIEE